MTSAKFLMDCGFSMTASLNSCLLRTVKFSVINEKVVDCLIRTAYNTNHQHRKTQMAKFVISKEEAIVAVRNQYGLPESVEIEINKDCSIEQDDFAWQNVPSNWKYHRAPEIADCYTLIDVMKRDGSILTGSPSDWWGCWSQNGSYADIVKFRKANGY